MPYYLIHGRHTQLNSFCKKKKKKKKKKVNKPDRRRNAFVTRQNPNYVSISDQLSFAQGDRLVGLVVKASASRAEDPGFESRLRQEFSGSSHTSDLKIGTPMATLPGAWRCRVSAGTG